ncbi:hypothetical protein TRV_00204 [Trichophyton verrucosum HKI 0517]|uniref:Metallo-beta-lactamase domain-containing protein n=1 Tax=Trichophyton verrucosum (strain HKI 0517) TaxID=663202 RepID=D4CZG2_TRIVH|nr:uncharacterized protein TRV_00204 [Trichophyton verrucosum HKI 0517]EFE44953.1 hypothetical protein TRV_00204 [Trichophyton verrucosum HKI 0517]
MESKEFGTAIPTPGVDIPISSSTVNVRVIDTNTLVHLNPKLFWEPMIEGFTGFHAPSYCFLVSSGTRNAVFDLGIRTDWRNYAPKVVSVIEETTVITVGSDVASIIESDAGGLNLRREDIQAVIWSHNHFDHIGDMSVFPPTTDLVVGPGARDIALSGWPQNPDSFVLESDTSGRVVREISFDNCPSIGRFRAKDFFGNGSFYLLDAPGHAQGHLCALARTTADPPSFIFMGADACHHPGVLRPSSYLPLPVSVKQGEDKSTGHRVLVRDYARTRCPTKSIFEVSHGFLFPDRDAAMETVGKVQEFDALDNVFVIISHDVSLSGVIPLFPQTINSWKTDDLKGKTRWRFCGY